MPYLKKIMKRTRLDATLEIPEEFGDLVEVTIVPAPKKKAHPAGTPAPDTTLPLQSEFIRSILADPHEDVWNDL